MSVSSGDLGIAVLESPDGLSNWVAVDGTNLAATVDLGSNITATVSSVTVQINQAGGASSSQLDWAAGLDLDGDGVFGGFGDTVDPGANLPAPVAMPIQYSTGPLLALSGALTNLNVYNRVTGSANFAIAETKVDVSFSGGPAVDVSNASMLTVALTNLQASGLGLQISGGDLGIAVIEPPVVQNRTTTPASGSPRSATALTATLNLGSDVTYHKRQRPAADQRFRRHELDSTSPRHPIDWATDISQSGSTLTVNPGQNLNPAVDLKITAPASQQLTNPQGSSGNGAHFNIDNLVIGSAELSVSHPQSTVLVTGQQDLTNATLYSTRLD